VLESINPQPVPGGYSCVVSWLIFDPPHGIVHADAYDARGHRIKQFDPKNIEKVQGEYQLEAMEMSGGKAGTRTVIEFDLAHK
jgi:YD repeat-containing protein